jgi:dTDP-4-amino-4,6-dideoxygalactose transaminase
MTDVQAALGIRQLPPLDEWIEAREALAERYDALLADLPLVTPPPPTGDMLHASHLYQVEVTDDPPLSRDGLLDFLTSRRLSAGVHYRGVHLHPYYRDRYRVDPAAVPVGPLPCRTRRSACRSARR